MGRLPADFYFLAKYDNLANMKCVLVQFSPYLGLVEKNIYRHQEYIHRAIEEKADLIIFPELSLTGYTLKDLTPEVALNPYQDPRLQVLKELSQHIDIVLGLVEEKEKGLFFNAAIYLSQKNILHLHRKVFLPTFGLFEEGKFFASGRLFRPFRTSFGRAGLLICRDFLHYGASYVLMAGQTDLIIVISAAPGRGMSAEQGFASSHMWELMGETISRFSNTFVLYCNRVGFEDGVIFAGGSFAYDPWGKLLQRAPDAAEHLLFLDVDLEEVRRARKAWPFLRDDKPEVILHALERVLAENENQS